MKNVIEIKIECKGDAAGTLGWFNSIMQKSELVIKNCKDGEPGMFLKTPTKDDKMDYEFICKIWNKNSNPDGYNMPFGHKIICVYPEAEYYNHGFSDYPLTPACKAKVQEMINMAIDKFLEWWNEQ